MRGPINRIADLDWGAGLRYLKLLIEKQKQAGPRSRIVPGAHTRLGAFLHINRYMMAAPVAGSAENCTESQAVMPDVDLSPVIFRTSLHVPGSSPA